MDMNAIDIGTLLAIAGLIYKTTQDKIVQAEAMGRLKQQVTNLENKAAQIDTKFESIDDKLQSLLEGLTRLETIINQRD